MKHLAYLLLVLSCTMKLGSFDLFAQENISADRRSISVIIVNQGAGEDEIIEDAIANYKKMNNRFDINPIPTSILYHSPSEKELKAIGREVLSFWFNRNALTGMMDDTIVRARGEYNASDQDIRSGNATAIGKYYYEGQGYNLINNSFVLFVTYLGPHIGAHGLGSEVKIGLYRLQVSLDDFFMDCWIDDNDSVEVANLKRQAFDAYPVDLVKINEEVYTSEIRIGLLMSADEHTSRSIQLCLDKATGGQLSIEALDNDNVENQTELVGTLSGSIVSGFPLMAKLGDKEDLKNGDRFKVYKYREREDGKITEHVTGHVRAAHVRDNKKRVNGFSSASSFYKVAGFAKPGQTIVKENSRPWSYSVGISADYYNKHLDVTNWIATATARRLLEINSWGLSHYLLCSGYLDLLDIDDVTSLQLTVGYGLGFRPIHFLEVMPMIKLGLGYEGDIYPIDGYIYPVVKVGGRISTNIWYPFGVFIEGETNSAVDFDDTTIYDGTIMLSAGIHLWF